MCSLSLMATSPATRPDDGDLQLRLALQGDRAAWGDLLDRHRNRLRRMITLRLIIGSGAASTPPT